MSDSSPFHIGEKKIQERLGVRDRIEPWARKVVRGSLPDQHRKFYAALPFLVAAARDLEGRPWATLLTGTPGFAFSPDPDVLRIHALPSVGDALAGSMRDGSDLGLLGIEFSTRRRNRLNGQVTRRGDDFIELGVGQAFGNCPQYIHERNWRYVSTSKPSFPANRYAELSADAHEMISEADTFFIATGYRGEGESEAFGMDASHRGGDPGFVSVEGSRRLVFPDYAGNNHYNTVGNLLMDSRAGLLFVDFKTGNQLQLTGLASIDDAPSSLTEFPGAQRLIRFEVEEAVEQTAAIPLRWDGEASALRSLRITSKTKESENVTSFLLESTDGEALDRFEAGQHLPIKLAIPGQHEAVTRTYSLSNGPSDSHYRITVKRETLGLASRHLHDGVAPGDLVSVASPAGDFVLVSPPRSDRGRSSSPRPVVLLSAGVGVTPMVSMLHALNDLDMKEPIKFFHGARNGNQHPLAAEVRRLADKSPNVEVIVRFSRPQPGDVSRHASHSEGRLDGATLERHLNSFDADFYLCGPVEWMAMIHEHLEGRGVPLEQIHSESFGPA